MPRWLRILRGVIGTGFVFAAGGIALALLFAIGFAIAGQGSVLSRFDPRFSVVGFILGVGFSGLLVLSSRLRKLADLSLPGFTALGASAGLIYYLVIAAMNAGRPGVTLLDLSLLTVLGAGSAAAMVLIARRAKPQAQEEELEQETRLVGEGPATNAEVRREETKTKVR